MIRKDIREKKYYIFSFLLAYFVSFSPSFLVHQHSLNELSHCEGPNENIDAHSNCTHKAHFNYSEDKCLVCDFSFINEHLYLSQILKINNVVIREKDCDLSERIYLKQFTNHSNKSPPIFI